MGLYSDLNLDNGQYIPQYAGAPLKELQDTADVLSTRHYGNIAQASQLQILANQLKSELLPGAKAHVDSHINALDEALQGMAKSGGENSTARITALANSLKGDQGLLNAGKRSKEYQKQSDIIDQLTAQGHIPVYDKRRREELANAGVGADVYNSPYSALVEPFKDPTKDWKQLLEVIKPDQFLVQGLEAKSAEEVKKLLNGLSTGKNDPLIFTKLERLGVTKDKIEGLRDKLVSSYKNMDSYQQQKNASLGEGFGKTDAQIEEDLMKYAGLFAYHQDKTSEHILPGANIGNGNGTGPTYGGAGGRESIGAGKMDKVNFDFDLDFKPPVAPAVVNTTQYSIPGSRQAVQNQNTGNVYTNNPDRQAELQEKFNQDTKEYNAKLDKLQDEAKLATELVGGAVPDVKTEEGKQKAIELATQYRTWVNGRMVDQGVNKVPQETNIAHPAKDEFGYVVPDVNGLTKDTMDNISRRKMYSLPDAEGNTTQNSDQQTRPQWNDLLKSKKDELVATGYLDPRGPDARKAGPEFMGGPVMQYTDRETGKVYQYVATPSTGELMLPRNQQAQFVGQTYNAFNTKPGQQVTAPYKIFTQNGWENRQITGQELIGGQRDKVLKWLETNDPAKYKIAINYPSMYSIVNPKTKEEEIHFSLDLAANAILGLTPVSEQ